jgi:ketosteroid isomerase-like protein
LREIAEAINSNGDYRIAEWFTEDFRLIEPTRPNWPEGHVGASKLLETFRMLTPPVNFAILDMIEEGDRVAVRWQLSATHHGEPLNLAMIAIYRFEDGRIAEDWGFSIRGEWLG